MAHSDQRASVACGDAGAAGAICCGRVGWKTLRGCGEENRSNQCATACVGDDLT